MGQVSDEIRVVSLHYYPIKSCRGLQVDELQVGPRGPSRDRLAMVVDASGVFVSQRTHPKMARIEVRAAEDALEIAAPAMERLRLTLEEDAAGEAFPVRIWKDTVEASAFSTEADDWFSRFLGEPSRLVRIANGRERDRIKDPYPETFHCNFADSAPFLLTNQASLEDLNARSAARLPMDRFRANIVVAGARPYEEDEWAEIRIGPISFPCLFACDRCSITTVDQRSGVSGKEPLVTLATYRKAGSGVIFGSRMIHRGEGLLRVGDRVVVNRLRT